MDVVALALEGKLYARKAAVKQLKEAYRQRRNELVLLVGEAGSGKSALAHTLRKTVRKSGGFFISGKCDEVRTDSVVASGSNSPIALALVELTDLVRKNSSLLATMRAAVQHEIAAEGHLLTDMIPALDIFIDSSLANEGSQGYKLDNVRTAQVGREGFELVFGKFVRAIGSSATAGHPIVLFVDDLQWSDSWSLSLLHVLLQNKGDNWLVFGAVRDDEVCPNDHLSTMLRQLEDEEHLRITQIHLSNLDEQAVKEAVLDLLRLPAEDCQSLISIVHQQTSGNPLFLRQYLQYLCEEGLLFVDRKSDRWRWKQNQIEANLFENVVNMLEAKMNKLAPSLQHLLKVAACLGSTFSPILVEAAEGGDLTQVNLLVERGFLSKNGGIIRWQHDKMRQAAFRLDSDVSCDELHFEIGWKMYRNLSESHLEENLLLVLGQLSCGARLLVDQETKTSIAKLCLRGGEKAVLCSNFTTAASCFALGLNLLPTRSWRDEYDLTLALHNFAAETEYCVGNLARMDDLIDKVLLNARSFTDKLRATTFHIYALGGRNRHDEAVRIGLQVLAKLGEHFPSKGLKIFAMHGLARTRSRLRGRTTEYLLRLPVMEDRSKLAATSVLSLLLTSAAVSSLHLATLFLVRLMQITLKYGLCAPSSLAFSYFAILVLRRGNVEEAFQYGQLALATIEKFQATEYLPRVFGVVYSGISTWRYSLRSCLERLAFAREVAMETGDIESAVLNSHLYALNSVCAGCCLEDVLHETQKLIRMAEKYGQDMVHGLASLLMQFLLNISGRSKDPLMMTCEDIDQEAQVQRKRQSANNLALTTLFYYRFVLAFYFNEYDLAETLACRSRPNDLFDSGTLIFCLHSFYEAMTAMALAHHSRDRRRIARARNLLRRLKHYEKMVPSTCQNKVLLVEAEMAAFGGNLELALAKFTRSIDKAGEEGFMHEQALACERAGSALRRLSDFAGAAPLLCRAQVLYHEWGAQAKAIQLSKMYSLDAVKMSEQIAPGQSSFISKGRTQ